MDYQKYTHLNNRFTMSMKCCRLTHFNMTQSRPPRGTTESNNQDRHGNKHDCRQMRGEEASDDNRVKFSTNTDYSKATRNYS